MIKVIIITIEKGGVGKTTIATHLFYHLIFNGYKVAFLDADGQGNSSIFLKPLLSDITAIDFFTRKLTKLSNRDVVFSSTRDIFALKDIDLTTINENKEFLNEQGFDFLIIDTNPALSNCSVPCIILSDIVFLPINMSEFAYKSVNNTIQFIKDVKQKHSLNIDIGGLIPNMVNTKSPEQLRALANLIDKYPDKVMPFLGFRAPYTATMNNTTPLWKRYPIAGNVKVAANEMKKLYHHMEAVLNG